MARRRVNDKDFVNGVKPGCEFCRHEANHAAIGHDLRAEREAYGMAQAEIARALGVSATYICDLEAGRRNWTPKTIERYLAAVRGTTYEEDKDK